MWLSILKHVYNKEQFSHWQIGHSGQFDRRGRGCRKKNRESASVSEFVRVCVCARVCVRVCV